MEDDDPVARRAATLKAEINALKERMRGAVVSQPAATMDIGAIAAALAKELEDFGRKIDQQDVPHIQRLLLLVVQRMEGDLVTKEVEVDLSLPSWLGEALQRHGPVGLDELFAYRPFIKAHPENAQVLAQFKCNYHRKLTESCYQCRRLRHAA